MWYYYYYLYDKNIELPISCEIYNCVSLEMYHWNTVYIIGINDANAKQTLALATKLADGLNRIKFLYTCYTKKLQLINFVKANCRNGTKSLKALYVEATGHFNTGGKLNDDTCKSWVGVPYYSYANMEAQWKITAKSEQLSTDCILNSSGKKEKACRYVYSLLKVRLYQLTACLRADFITRQTLAKTSAHACQLFVLVETYVKFSHTSSGTQALKERGKKEKYIFDINARKIGSENEIDMS